MTLLRTYRPTASNSKMGINSASELFNRFFEDERQACNQFFAVPPANIVENEQDYRIEIAAPGFEKSDFSIELNENVLEISLDKEDKNQEEQGYVMREFNFSKFNRTFKLSDKIDKEKIGASYKNGILSITLPIKEEILKNTNRSIDIE